MGKDPDAMGRVIERDSDTGTQDGTKASRISHNDNLSHTDGGVVSQ